jgi:hypothetical protein
MRYSVAHRISWHLNCDLKILVFIYSREPNRPLFVSSRKRKPEYLEDVPTGAQQDPSSAESSSSDASILNSTFCSRCANIDFHKIVLEKWNTSSVRLGSFSRISLESSCRLCSLFSFIVTKFVDDVSEDDWIFYLYPFYTSRIYAANWSWKPVTAGVEETVSFAILDERTFREGTGYVSQN